MKTRYVWWFVGVVLVVVGVVFVWQVSRPTGDGSGDSQSGVTVGDPHGEDVHGQVDPMVDDPYVIARMIASAMYSYNPAEDETPVVEISRMKDRLTGQMTQVVEVPDDLQARDSLYPRQWWSWKESQARVRGFAETLNYTEGVAVDRVTAKMHVRQIIYSTDGDETPFREFDLDMDMVRIDGAWKAEAFRVYSISVGRA